MAVKDKISGAWRDVTVMYDKVGGVWRKTAAEWVKVNGQWKMTYDGISSTYFERNTDNLDRLHGDVSFSEAPGAMMVSVTGYTGGYNSGCIVGWLVKGLPAGSNVQIEWEYLKAGGAMNDIHIWTETHQLELHSDDGVVTSRTLTTNQHTGWIRFFIDFFPTYQTTTWLKIKKITVDGRQVWPAA